VWTTPAERCFLWMGGFRPSDLLKVWTYICLTTEWSTR
jgi:transcription factor TGA